MQSIDSGVWAALPTFFHQKNTLNLELWIDYLNHYNHKWDGVVIGGSTGEGVYLSLEELKILIQCARNLMPKKNIFAGIFSFTVEDAILRAKTIGKSGGTGVLITLPPYVCLDSLSAIGFFKHVISATQDLNLSWIIYNNPIRIGTDFTLHQFKNLVQALPEANIIGYKDSSGDSKRASLWNLFLNDQTLNNKKYSYFCGNDDEWITSSKHSVQGIISVAACVFPDRFIEIFKGDLSQEDAFYLMIKQFKKLPNPLALKAVLSGLYNEDCLITRVPFDQTSYEKDIFELQEWSKKIHTISTHKHVTSHQELMHPSKI
jgi:dihydrodipicolinate synthase/N-acetylneuraminate lyase